MEFLFNVSGNCRGCIFAIIISGLELNDFPFSKKIIAGSTALANDFRVINLEQHLYAR
jgi:hypothetical protein